MNISSEIYVQDEIKTNIIEKLFFGYLIYSLTAVPLGISFPYIAGLWLGALALETIFHLDWKISSRIVMILILSISSIFLFIQIIVHGMSFSMPYMTYFIIWIEMSIVIFRLSTRKGFIMRLAIVMFIIGIILQFYVTTHVDVVARTRIGKGSGIDNSNDYGAWMGFCALIFWQWGLNKTNKVPHILLIILFAISAFFMLGTVSRGALLSLSVGMIVGIRGNFQRKWLWIVIIIGISFLLLNRFSIDKITNYQARMNEESGRLQAWPNALIAIKEKPIWGYGVYRITHRGAGILITPHNGLLFFLLSAGIFPSILFIFLWIRAFTNSIKNKYLVDTEIDPLPLLIFAFIEMMTSNLYFMFVWCVSILFYCYNDVNHKSNKLIIQFK